MSKPFATFYTFSISDANTYCGISKGVIAAPSGTS
jgi:hypothetical protein